MDKINPHVLPSGQVPPNPSELLGSRSMAKLLEQLASQYDVVLIDTPPLLPVTDAAILATITGGALAVAGACLLHRLQLADGGDGPGADGLLPAQALTGPRGGLAGVGALRLGERPSRSAGPRRTTRWL